MVGDGASQWSREKARNSETLAVRMSCDRDRRSGALIRRQRSRMQRRYARSLMKGRPCAGLRAPLKNLNFQNFLRRKIFGNAAGVDCSGTGHIAARVFPAAPTIRPMSASDRVPPDKTDVAIVRRCRIIGLGIVRAGRLDVGRRVGGSFPAASIVVRLDRPIDPKAKSDEQNRRG